MVLGNVGNWTTQSSAALAVPVGAPTDEKDGLGTPKVAGSRLERRLQKYKYFNGFGIPWLSCISRVAR